MRDIFNNDVRDMERKIRSLSGVSPYENADDYAAYVLDALVAIAIRIRRLEEKPDDQNLP